MNELRNSHEFRYIVATEFSRIPLHCGAVAEFVRIPATKKIAFI